MNLRLTYRVLPDSIIDVSLDTDTKNDVIYSMSCNTKEQAIHAIKSLIEAANAEINIPIEINDTFGNYIVETDLDFNNNTVYLDFCKSAILSNIDNVSS